MGLRKCTVSFTDARQCVHSVEVTAETVYEAAAEGLKLLDAEYLNDDTIAHLRVEIHTVTVHEVPVSKLKQWIDSSSRGPKEHMQKARFRKETKFP